VLVGRVMGWPIRMVRFRRNGCHVPMNTRLAGGPPRRLGAAVSSCRLSAKTRQLRASRFIRLALGSVLPRAAPCRDRRSLAAAPRRQPAPPTPRSPRARMCRCWDPSDRPACRAHHAEVLYDRMHGRIRRECPSHKVLRRLPRQCDGARRRPNSDAANRSLFAHTASVAAALGATALGASRSSKR
jgi:hypothetical protein